MHVDYKHLEGWLHQKLKPLCVADPVPLSQYVIALIKKEKPEKELRAVCIDQLEVFLQENTINFVDDLFATLNNRSYIIPNQVESEVQSKLFPDTKTSKPEGRTDSSKDKKRHMPSEGSDSSESKQKHGRSGSKKPKSMALSKSRSRSPQPSSRTASSLTSTSVKSGRRATDRENSPEGSVLPRNRSDRSDDITASRRVSSRLGRDESDDDRRYKREYESESYRDRATRERLRSPERDKHGMSGRMHPGIRSVSGSRRRCRDFEQRGFCAFGSQCLFDHGPSPLVLPSSQVTAATVSQTPSISFSGAPVIGSSLVVTQSGRIPSIVSAVVPDASGSQSQADAPVYRPTPISSAVAVSHGIGRLGDPVLSMCQVQPEEDQAPSAQQHNSQIGRNFRGPSGSASVRRNIVPIPMVSIPNFSGASEFRAPLAYEPDKPQISVISTFDTAPVNESPWIPSATATEPQLTYTPSPITDRAAVTASALGPTESSFPRELYVTRIPWRLNNDIKLAEHFSKFGSLVRIVSRYMGLPDTALVEYSSADEAEKTFRSPEPILANRFIRLSTTLQNRTGRFRRGRQTPYELRSKTLSERLGHRPDYDTRNYDWLRSATDDRPAPGQYSYQTSRAAAQPKGSGSRWRLERNADTYPDAEAGDDVDGDIDRSHEDEDNDLYRNKSKELGYTIDRTSDTGERQNDYGSINTHSSNQFKFSISHKDKQETAAYLWQKQKALALKQREEQLKLLDKSREAKQSILEAQKQRVVRLQAQLKKIMSELEATGKTANGSQNKVDRKPANRAKLLAEAKRVQQDLEAALKAEKKALSSKYVSSTDAANIGSTATSAVALQALPEPLATERRKQMAEVHAALKQAEDDMAVLKAKGEPVTEQCRRVLELKRLLVHLETIRPSDFTDPFNGDTSGSSDIPGAFPTRAQTKLDKRPRTVFVSGLGQADVNHFIHALAVNYLHTQQVAKHSEPGTNQPILEITFCTRDFAEAAMRQFREFHGHPLSMSFEPPPLADTVASNEATHSSVVSSTQSGLPAETDCSESTSRLTSYSPPHSSPTTTVQTTD